MNTITHNGVEYQLPAYFQHGSDGELYIKVITPIKMIWVKTYRFAMGLEIVEDLTVPDYMTPSNEETFLLSVSRAMKAINSVLPVKIEQP